MPFAAAMSEHPVTAHAVGEAAGSVLEQIGACPDLVMVFVTTAHAGALEDAAAAIESILAPTAVIGCAAESVVGPHREVERTQAVSVFAARTGPLLPVVLQTTASPDGLTVTGWPDPLAFEPQCLILLADPFSFAAGAFLEWMEVRHPGIPVTGAMASGAAGPGGNRMSVGPVVRHSGAVGVVLGPGADVRTVVSQGCRAFGQPLVVTRARDNIIFEMAGTPALARLVEHASTTLTAREVDVLEHGGLHLGRVVDEHRAELGRGDFLMRSVLGGDRSNGAIAVSDAVPVGTTVQFHLRDAHTAHEDLHGALRDARADGALLFTCNGRGTRLFAEPHHDVTVVAEQVGTVPLAGCFASGELGPVGGRNFVHGLTASVVLFTDPPVTDPLAHPDANPDANPDDCGGVDGVRFSS